MSKLTVPEFLDVVKKTPLVAIDLVIQNKCGHIFVGKRVNNPAKNYWFVPGGRILKNELFADTLVRLMREELGIDHFIGSYIIMGVYDHLYETCFYEPNPTITTTHYVVTGVKIQIDNDAIDYSKIPAQHSHYKWIDVDSLLADESVHPNTKKYFTDTHSHQIDY